MKSTLITKFKNKLLRERRTFTKIFVSDEIPSGLEASREGIVHFTTRVGGQLHQMYSLAEMSAVLPSVPPVGSTEPPIEPPPSPQPNPPKDVDEGPIEPRPREDGPPGSQDGFWGNPDDAPHGDDPRRYAPQDDPYDVPTRENVPPEEVTEDNNSYAIQE